jgi:outer membrane immunogenic protein
VTCGERVTVITRGSPMTVSTRIAVIGVAGALAAIAVPATAADLGRRYPAPAEQPLPPAPLGTSWSGFYIGGNLGAAFDPNDLSIKDLSEEQDLSLKFSNDTEFMGGVQGGYNWQMGSWVAGVEGDIDFAENINYLASVRGRLGWALGSWLLYGTAGVAFIDTDNDFVVVSADDGPFSFSNGNNDTGFVVGGGVDYKIAPQLSLGLEGLFYDFGSDSSNLVAGDEPFVLKEDEDFAVVRARLNYHFNSGY